VRTTVGKALAALKFAATRRGPLATPTGDVMAVFKTRQDLDRGDGQFLARLMSVADVSGEERGQIDSHGGVSCAAEILRPTSEGSVWSTSADPSAPLSIDPNYLATDYDRRTMVGVVRKIREIFERSPLVDDQLRVRGIEGLRIVDCSIMPTMISGNLTGPMLAMAGRAAELILDTTPAERVRRA
jgi:choline dehydrogenase-like flavoprotein